MKKTQDTKKKNNKKNKSKKFSGLFYSIKYFFRRIKTFFFLCRYPFMAPHNVWTGKKVKFPSYSEYDLIPTGWRKAFGRDLLKDLKAALKKDPYDFYFVDIKEKYGTLRLYANLYSKEVEDVLFHYEKLSEDYCICCGDKVSYQFGFYRLCHLCLLNDIKDDRFASDEEMFAYMEEFKIKPDEEEDDDEEDLDL